MGKKAPHASPPPPLFFPRARAILNSRNAEPRLRARVLQRWRTRAVGSCDTVWLSEGQIEMASGEEGRLDRESERDNDEREFVVCPVQSPRIPEARRLVRSTGHHRHSTSSQQYALRSAILRGAQTPVRFCGCTYLAVAPNWSPKCKNSLFICDLTCATCRPPANSK